LTYREVATKGLTPFSPDEGKFVAALAHDINNPLDSLLTALYLLTTESGLSDGGQQNLKIAQDEAHRIYQLVRTAAGQYRTSYCPEDANVPALMRSVLNFYESRFESLGIEVKARYCPDGDLRVYPGPLRQTFANLLLNAADALPKGGSVYARVALSHEWGGRHRLGLRITIADNGCGIPEEVLLEVWRPFFTTKGSTGMGIGLSLVREAVAKHDGVLSFRTSTRQGHSGSVFSIFLPAA
jgi:signal transduction histidine kinase